MIFTIKKTLSFDTLTADSKQDIATMRQMIISYLKSKAHLYTNIDIKTNHIYFENETLLNMILPFYNFKSYQIDLAKSDNKIDITYSASFYSHVIFIALGIIGLFIQPLVGLCILGLSLLFLIMTRFSADNLLKTIIKSALDTGLQADNTYKQDDNKCPACNNFITDQDTICSDCGLTLKKNNA